MGNSLVVGSQSGSKNASEIEFYQIRPRDIDYPEHTTSTWIEFPNAFSPKAQSFIVYVNRGRNPHNSYGTSTLSAIHIVDADGTVSLDAYYYGYTIGGQSVTCGSTSLGITLSNGLLTMRYTDVPSVNAPWAFGANFTTDIYAW